MGARAHAGLKPEPAYVIGAVLPSYGFEPDEQLTLEARQHYNSGRYDLAVIRAQTGCELYAVAALRHTLRRCFGDWDRAVAVAGHLRPALSDRRTQDLIALLTGEVVTDEPWWPAYRAHLQRRNAIVHEGVLVSADEAASSLEAVKQCWDWLFRLWAGERRDAAQ
jgi:hypothetical protein